MPKFQKAVSKKLINVAEIKKVQQIEWKILRN
jgi:hypothetical protein